MRKLATIKVIDEILPIEGADKIELVKIGGWNVVTAKDVGHKVGDSVVYCEIDSFLPIEPEFEFLRKSSFKRMGDQEGFRLKTIKLRGQVSQGLVIPLIDAINVMLRRNPRSSLPIVSSVGDDCTELLGIVKYEPPIPAQLAGLVRGNFPSFIKKTDEERIQNLHYQFLRWREEGVPFYITEKLDGSSATFYMKDGEFGVCSRNLDLTETEGNSFWAVARKLKLEEKLKSLGRNLSLQGELIGEGIQGNRYGIKGQDVRFFNVFDIDQFKRVSREEFFDIMDTLKLDTVPYLDLPYFLPETMSELIEFAEAKSQLNQKAEREGIVLRTADNDISFKVISNKFLLKGGE